MSFQYFWRNISSKKLSGVFDFNNYKEIFSGVFDFNNQQTNFLEFLILTIYKEILSGVFDFNNYKEILSGVFDFNNKKKSKCLEWGSNPRLHRRIELKSTALDHSAIEALLADDDKKRFKH